MEWWNRVPGMYFRQDLASGGTGEATAEPVEDTGDVGEEEQPTEEQPEEGAEAAVEEGEGEGEPAVSAKPPVKKKGGPPETVPYKRVQELTEELRELRQQVARVMPPGKDPLDGLVEAIEKLPEEHEDRKMLDDLKALSPILKRLRPALVPEVGVHSNLLAGIMQAVNKLNFVTEALQETLVDGETDRRPPSLKNLDKVEAQREKFFKENQGRAVQTYQDAFAAVREQMEAEEAQAAEKESTIRQDERARQEQRTAERKGASQASTVARARPAPKAPAGPQRLSYQEIERRRQAGENFVVG